MGVLICLLLSASWVLAREDDDFDGEFELLQDEETVFTASKHEQDINESPSAITVITREQIENTYCTDVICLLRQVPEVDVIRIKPAYPAVGARALTDEVGEKVLLRVDGREINNEIFGIPFWSAMPVHLEDIQRIEVIRGPGSALYGANAHSMVVSVFSRSIDENTYQAFLGSGEHDRSNLHLRLGQALGDWRLQLTGGLDTAGHWQIPNYREREVSRIRLHLEHHAEQPDFTFQLGLVHGDGPIYSALGPAVMKDLLVGDLGISYKADFFESQLTFSFMDSNIVIEIYEVYFQGTLLGKVPRFNPFFGSDLDGQVQFNWSPFKGNLLIAGANLRWLTCISENADPNELHQLRAGLFLHDEHKLGENLLLTAGIRFDYNNITPFTISPRLTGVYNAAQDHFLRLGFGQAFRKPSFFNSSIHLTNVEAEPAFPEFSEFFLDGIGNEDLENESITSLEAGYRGRFLEDRLSIEADVFYNRYRNTINLHVEMVNTSLGLPDLRNSKAQYFNTGREADSLGGSLSVTCKIQNNLRLSANYTYRYSWYTSEPGGTAAVGEGRKGDRVSWEPSHLANMSLSYLPQNGLRLGLGWHGASSKEGYVVAEGSSLDRRSLVPVPASWFLSGFLAWRLDFDTRWVELGVRAFNLLNTPFRDLPAITQKTWETNYRLGAEKIGRRILFFLRGNL